MTGTVTTTGTTIVTRTGTTTDKERSRPSYHAAKHSPAGSLNLRLPAAGSSNPENTRGYLFNQDWCTGRAFSPMRLARADR